MTFNPSLKNALFFFAFGFVFGLFISFLWAKMLIPDYKTSAKVESPEELVKQVTVTETMYIKKADSIKGESQKLKTKLSNTKAALIKAKERAGDLQKQMFVLLDDRFALRQQGESDTVCDSLASAVPILIAVSEEKDSLYNSALANLESQVHNKDSTIALHDLRYVDLKSAFSKSIDAQTILAKDNLSLNKTVSRQKVKSKVVAAALFILSGAAASYLLHH